MIVRHHTIKLAFLTRTSLPKEVMNLRHGHHFRCRPLISLNRAALIISACIAFSVAVEAGKNFYVDPDWAGKRSGTQAYPFAVLNKSEWQKINAALASGDVTIYFSALKADGVTQQSKAWFVQCRRTDYGPYRLTLDGYSFYNSSERSANWLPNPEPDIAVAYTTGKVFKITGDGSNAFGWGRTDGNDFVTHNGLVYCCVESHRSAADNEPGVGANWTLYWDQHEIKNREGGAKRRDSSFPFRGSNWAPGRSYRCYVKQNNITLRGFEITGRGARSSFNGDNFVWEYNYVHDVTGIGPGMALLYTSHPDTAFAQIVSRPSTNLILRNFRVERTYGEGLYLGAINPDAPAAFQAAHGDQHDHILIENFYIGRPGANGGQGDGIDCKNGITYLTIRRGEITGYGANGNAINLPYSAANVNQNNLVERVYMHDSAFDGQGAQRCISAQTGGAHSTRLHGYVGLTIRNCICANSYNGIVVSGSTSPNQPVDQTRVFNNTIYGIRNTGLSVSTNISNSVVQNNFVFATGVPTGLIGSSGVISDYNAHDGSWTSATEGSHTLALTSQQALASVVNPTSGDFRPGARSPLKRHGLAIPSFSDDFYQGSRASGNWSIGAVQVSGDGPAIPSGLQGSSIVQ